MSTMRIGRGKDKGSLFVLGAFFCYGGLYDGRYIDTYIMCGNILDCAGAGNVTCLFYKKKM